MRRRNAVYVRRNVKQVAWHVAIGVGLFFAVRLVWGWQAGREYTRLAKEIEAKGVSLDITPRLPPDPNNSAVALARAVAPAVTVSGLDYQLLEGDGRIRDQLEWNDPRDRAKAFALLTRLRPAFDRLDAITALQQKPHFATPDIMLGECKGFAELLRADAILTAQNLDEATALHRENQILLISQLLGHDETELGFLIGLSTRAWAGTVIEQLQPELRLEDQASRDEAAATIRALDDDGFLKQRGERDRLGDVKASHWDLEFDSPELKGWWLRSFRVSLLNGSMRWALRMAPFYGQADYRGAERAAGPAWSSRPNMSLLDLLAIRYTSGADAPAVLMECRCISDSHAAAMLLAADLYEQKYGRFPAAAGEMVPEFLGKVPVDPFDPAKGPMRYRLDVDGPTIWSVGENGTDEHAAIRFAYGERAQRYGNSTNDQPDIIYGAAWRDAAAGPAKGPATAR